MKILNIKPNTDEWLIERLENFCASESPVVMGASKFMTRDQLLRLKKGWIDAPNSAFKERLFQSGHDHEDQARPIVSAMHLVNFQPTIGQLQVDGIKTPLLASFDGYCAIDDGKAWEHKDWNETLADNVRNMMLEPHYYWQLEHQALVAGIDSVEFTVSNGTSVKMESMRYESQRERRNDLIAALKLFEIDLENYQLEAKVEQVKAVKKSLPVVQFEVAGTEIRTNIEDCLADVLYLAEVENSRDLQTDQDFANKDQLNKDVKKARAALKATISDVRNKFVSFAEFEKMALEIDAALQKMQSHGEKQVKEAKEAKKNEIKAAAMLELQQHIDQHNSAFPGNWTTQDFVDFEPNWTGVMKNKRTLDSLSAAVLKELARIKLEINKVVEQVVPNLIFAEGKIKEYPFLFTDLTAMASQPAEAFQAVVSSRIAQHKEQEEKRLEAERERIQQEEEAKARQKVEREAAESAEAERALNDEPQLPEPTPNAEPEKTFEPVQPEQQALNDEEQRLFFLNCLIGAGVDNWVGYDMAIESFLEQYPHANVPR